MASQTAAEELKEWRGHDRAREGRLIRKVRGLCEARRRRETKRSRLEISGCWAERDSRPPGVIDRLREHRGGRGFSDKQIGELSKLIGD